MSETNSRRPVLSWPYVNDFLGVVYIVAIEGFSEPAIYIKRTRPETDKRRKRPVVEKPLPFYRLSTDLYAHLRVAIDKRAATKGLHGQLIDQAETVLNNLWGFLMLYGEQTEAEIESAVAAVRAGRKPTIEGPWATDEEIKMLDIPATSMPRVSLSPVGSAVPSVAPR